MNAPPTPHAPAPTYATPCGRVRLYHADALLTLERADLGPVHHLCTDPPYSSGALHASGRRADPLKKYQHGGSAPAGPSFTGDSRDQRSWTKWMSWWLAAAARHLTPGAYAHLFTDWRQLPSTTDALQAAGLTWRGVACWNKGLGSRAPHKGYHRHQAEFVAWGTLGPCTAGPHGPFPGVYDEPVRSRDKQHPTAKPLPLMRRLLEPGPPGRVVLDPFFGSGQTLVAALEAGHRVIGVEQNDHYFALGVDRVRALLAA